MLVMLRSIPSDAGFLSFGAALPIGWQPTRPEVLSGEAGNPVIRSVVYRVLTSSSTSFAWLLHMLLVNIQITTAQSWHLLFRPSHVWCLQSLSPFHCKIYNFKALRYWPIAVCSHPNRVAGFVGAVIDPAWFMNEQVPQSNVINPSGNSIMVTWQLGNLYLLLGFLGIAILSTTNEIRVVRAYLVALWLGDIGHVGFSYYGLGWDMSMSPMKWNAVTWGNIAMTVSQRNEVPIVKLANPSHNNANMLLVVSLLHKNSLLYWALWHRSRQAFHFEKGHLTAMGVLPQTIALG